MKKFVLTILAIMCVASPALAQYGDLSAYSDLLGTSCNISDAAPALVPVFILLKHTSGATAVKFMVTKTAGATMGWIGDQPAPGALEIGNSQTGAEVAFACQAGDVFIMQINYFGSGTSTPCSYINVVDAPGTPIPGEVIIVDCTTPFGERRAVGRGQAIVNPNGSCQCNVPANEKTWGAIKALYQ